MTTGRWVTRGGETVLAHRHRARRVAGEKAAGPDEAPHALHPAGILALQRTAGNAATSALLRRPHLYLSTGLVVQRQPKSKTASDPIAEAGTALRDVEAWADTQKRAQNVIDSAAVVGLDPRQASSVRSAAAKIAAYVPTLRAAGARLDPSLAALGKAVSLANDADKLTSGRADDVDRMNAAHKRTESADAVAAATALVGKLGPGIDVAGMTKNLTAIEAALRGGNSIREVLKYLNKSVSELQNVKDAAAKRGDAAVKVDILLRGFLATNDPGFAGAPSAAEIAVVKSQLSGGLGEEIADVFGSSIDYQFFVDFANSWGQQVEARTAMSKATSKTAPAIPDRSDAQAYFTALATKGNTELFDAYAGFAGAFFVHRGIASEADLRRGVDELFAARASITGRRGLVCTGYARMGAEVLGKAGAKLSGFSVGVHADDDMVLAGRFDEQGHAIARMTRGGTAFSVSNGTVVATANALVGKGAIAWGDQSKPLFVGDGASMDAAVDNLLAKLEARRRVLERKN